MNDKERKKVIVSVNAIALPGVELVKEWDFPMANIAVAKVGTLYPTLEEISQGPII